MTAVVTPPVPIPSLRPRLGSDGQDDRREVLDLRRLGIGKLPGQFEHASPDAGGPCSWNGATVSEGDGDAMPNFNAAIGLAHRQTITLPMFTEIIPSQVAEVMDTVVEFVTGCDPLGGSR